MRTAPSFIKGNPSYYGGIVIKVLYGFLTFFYPL